jgi:DNA repair exonuclease SbcCD ATPase subunit
MRLIAADYEHIGPFDDHRTVIFKSHATLIQAAIGSGKSFLFFDGILFGLYKQSSRPMLHNHADQGAIVIVFEVDTVTYIIQRRLRHGSSADRVQSTLYTYSGNIQQLLDQHYPSGILHINQSLRDHLTTS